MARSIFCMYKALYPLINCASLYLIISYFKVVCISYILINLFPTNIASTNINFHHINFLQKCLNWNCYSFAFSCFSVFSSMMCLSDPLAISTPTSHTHSWALVFLLYPRVFMAKIVITFLLLPHLIRCHMHFSQHVLYTLYYGNFWFFFSS